MSRLLRSVREELEELPEEKRGQLIISTHNTAVLEELPSADAYIINSDAYGNKEVKGFDEVDKTRVTHNLHKRYLDGDYGGIPFPTDIYFTDYASELNDKLGSDD
jgi:predicted ATPase